MYWSVLSDGRRLFVEKQLKDLVAASRAGDSEAFGTLVEMYQPLLRSLCENSPESEQDDAMQEAIIALFAAVRSYDFEKKGVTFGLYAKICVKNRLISHHRRISQTVVDEFSEPLPEMQDPEQEAIANESYRELLLLIDRTLTPFELSVFKPYVLGKSMQEIAAMLGTNAKAVDNAVCRIKKKIKKLV